MTEQAKVSKLGERKTHYHRPEFKQQVVRGYWSLEKPSYNRVASEFGITRGAVKQWVQIAEDQGIEALMPAEIPPLQVEGESADEVLARYQRQEAEREREQEESVEAFAARFRRQRDALEIIMVERDRIIVDCARAKMSTRQIGKLAGLSHGHVATILQNHGFHGGKERR